MNNVKCFEPFIALESYHRQITAKLVYCMDYLMNTSDRIPVDKLNQVSGQKILMDSLRNTNNI